MNIEDEIAGPRRCQRFGVRRRFCVNGRPRRGYACQAARLLRALPVSPSPMNRRSRRCQFGRQGRRRRA